MTVDIQNDPQSVVNSDKRWLVHFNAPKTKRISINHRKETSLSSIRMADADFQESESLCLFG